MARIYINPEYLKHISSRKCQMKKEGRGLHFAGTWEGLAQAKFSRKSNTEVSLATAIVGLQS